MLILFANVCRSRSRLECQKLRSLRESVGMKCAKQLGRAVPSSLLAAELTCSVCTMCDEGEYCEETLCTCSGICHQYLNLACHIKCIRRLTVLQFGMMLQVKQAVIE